MTTAFICISTLKEYKTFLRLQLDLWLRHFKIKHIRSSPAIQKLL